MQERPSRPRATVGAVTKERHVSRRPVTHRAKGQVLLFAATLFRTRAWAPCREEAARGGAALRPCRPHLHAPLRAAAARPARESWRAQGRAVPAAEALEAAAYGLRRSRPRSTASPTRTTTSRSALRAPSKYMMRPHHHDCACVMRRSVATCSAWVSKKRAPPCLLSYSA